MGVEMGDFGIFFFGRLCLFLKFFGGLSLLGFVVMNFFVVLDGDGRGRVV